MNEIKIFENSEFGKVRTNLKDGEVWFCLADICKILEIGNATDVKNGLSERGVDKIEVGVKTGIKHNGTDAIQKIAMIFINEANLYKTIFRSRKPEAEKFSDWVTGEVLPSIRKHGGYIQNQENLSDEELMARALEVAQRKIAEKNKLIEEQASKIQKDTPKVLFADSVSASNTSILVGELAKLLNQNGIKTGQKRLFSWLRENGYLMKNTSSFNLPTQKAMELGLFEIKESTVINPDNSVRINKTTKVTGKGQLYFVNKFLGGLQDAI